MALDVYVGTLTRYYTEDWENVVQAMARQSGTAYIKIGGSGDAPAAEEVRPDVLQWRDELRRQWAARVPDAPDWREDDGAAYFTDRPGWEGVEAVQLQALCVDAGKTAPRKRLRDLSEHPLWQQGEASQFA